MAEKPILTRQQLEDAAKCSEIKDCESCSCVDICSVCFSDSMSIVAQTALALMDKVEKQKESLKLAKDALEYFNDLYRHNLQVAGWHLSGNTEPLNNFIDSAEIFEALDAIDKALGGSEDAS